MSAIVPAVGDVRQLDGPSEPDEQVLPADVQDGERMSRLMMRVLRDLAGLRRRWWPMRIDVEDRAVDGTGATKYRFPHGLGGRVRWWPVQWAGSGPCALSQHADTDDKTLVLVSYEAGTVTLRIEAAG